MPEIQNHIAPFPSQQRIKEQRRHPKKNPEEFLPCFSEIPTDEAILRSRLDASVAKRSPATRATTEGGPFGVVDLLELIHEKKTRKLLSIEAWLVCL